MAIPEATQAALRAFDTRGDAVVLDVAADSDLDTTVRAEAPRRMVFRRGGTTLEGTVQEGTEGLEVLVRLIPPQRFHLRALTRGAGLTVPSAGRSRSDTAGAARLTGLPRGITSLLLEVQDAAPLRTAWVRL